MNWILYFFAAAAGSLNSVQAGANSQLRKSLNAPLAAGLSVYLTGLIGLSIVALILGWPHLESAKLQATPWWAWMGGVLSIASTMAGVLLAQKMGSVAFTGITVTCSLTCSVLLDHFGWVGFQTHHANPWRLLGCALMVMGLILVSKF